jgi:kynurenine formamidase
MWFLLAMSLAMTACAAEGTGHPFEQVRFVDLTHELNEEIPTWPGAIPFSKERYVEYDQGYTKMRYAMGEGVGTHIDAPAHFLPGTRATNELELSELIGPAVVIDAEEKAARDADYALTREALVSWEAHHGRIVEGAIVVMRTGWSTRWRDVSAYRNMDEAGIMHFPGFSAEAARFLTDERAIAGIGIDTLSLDPGASPTFPVHSILFNQDKFLLENLTNLSALPVTGAWILALPLKVTDGPEAGARIVGAIPEQARVTPR